MIEAGLRERKKERTRQDLMRSALRLFADRGFDQVTVEELAAECDVSPRTFFRYFASKEDVLFAQGDRSLVRLLDTLRGQPAEVPALEALRQAVRTLAEDYEEDKEAVILRHRIMSATPALRTALRSASRGGRPRSSTSSGSAVRSTASTSSTSGSSSPPRRPRCGWRSPYGWATPPTSTSKLSSTPHSTGCAAASDPESAFFAPSSPPLPSPPVPQRCSSRCACCSSCRRWGLCTCRPSTRRSSTTAC